MKSLYLRIWLTVLLVLALFAAGSAWVFQHQLQSERDQAQALAQSRTAAWAALIQRSLPAADSSVTEQVEAVEAWAERLRMPLALDDAKGQRLATSRVWTRRESRGLDMARRSVAVPLDDGRVLWIGSPQRWRDGPPGASGDVDDDDRPPPPGGRSGDRWGHHGSGAPRMAPSLHGPGMPPPPWLGWSGGLGLVTLMVLLFLGIALAAWPVVRRLTRRLEALKQGVETFGSGDLGHRVSIEGHDEVASVARSFNQAADRVQTLLQSHRSLLANASHELRSPLARMKMAVSMMDEAPAEARQRWVQEVHTNIAELDALVEEVLLASRLDAAQEALVNEPVALLPLLAEEAARVQVDAEGPDLSVPGEEKLLRRAFRNLLENARRHAPGEIEAQVRSCGADGADAVEVWVCDRGPGVPEAWRERIFEPFMRLPGHAEKAGSVGLGLSLVRQIAVRHGGSVRCEPREGGGSCFVIRLPTRR
jgi:signal transduction histidine kinase